MTVCGLSGGPIKRFREGWAIVPFVSKPHFWRRRDLARSYASLCGLTVKTREGVGPLAPGVFMVERCKHCSKKAQVRAFKPTGDV